MGNSKRIRRIGILTGGGDCPGLNAVIRGVTKPALDNGISIIGIQDGFEGFVQGKAIELYNKDVSGIMQAGGTILGSSNKGDPFHWPEYDAAGEIIIQDRSHEVVRNYEGWNLDALVAIGGDGTMTIAHKLSQMGINVIGVPKTIDNDLKVTDVTFGHDSAYTVVSEAIDKLRTTASSHHRVMVVEVMGRYAGWIALNGGIAGGADIILIPEIPFEWEAIYDKVIERNMMGKKYSIVCVSEGAKPLGGEMVVAETDKKRTDPIKLGGIGKVVADNIEKNTRTESRHIVLGHLQRGGTPTPYDRILSTMFGTTAIESLIAGKFGHMVALKGTEIVAVPIIDCIENQKLVNPESQKVKSAKAVGVSFGIENL